MAKAPRPFRRIGRIDLILAALAAAGVLVYVLVLPGLSPNATATFALGEDNARQRAREALFRFGLEAQGLEPTVNFRRQTTLIDSLQRRLGRAEGLAALASDAGQQFPAYGWRVTWTPEDEDDDREYVISLTQQGAIWKVEHSEATDRLYLRQALQTRLNRGALVAAFEAEQAAGLLVPDTVLSALPDSILTDRMTFEATAEAASTLSPDSLVARFLAGGGFFRWSEGATEAMARHHLDRTVWGERDLVRDSTWVPVEGGGQVARVRFALTEPWLGQNAQVEVGLTAAGAFLDLDATFDAMVPREFDTGLSPRQVAVIASTSLGVLALSVMFFLFIRRLLKRRLDTKAALIDAGLITVSALLPLGLDFLIDADLEAPTSTMLTAALSFLASGLFLFALLTALSVVVTGASFSLGYVIWPDKMVASNLLRQGRLRNRAVGTGLVRGTLIGGGLLGVYVGVVALVPHWYIQVDGPRLLDQFISPFLMISGAAAGITILIWLVLIGVAGLVDRKGRLASLLLVAIVLIGGTSLNPMDVAPLEAQYILAVMTGVAAALIFWTFDLFTLFVAGWMTVLYLTVGEVWLVTDHPSQIDWYLLLIWTGLVVGVGLWGALRPERSQEAEEYVPGYIQELALQERMQRELEIAHQVQGFFLPRRMPDVPGVDLSAMCLAAQEVGGDYYDVVELDGGRLGVVIGDVSGKGIQAAFFMTLTKGFLQTLCRTLTSPAEVLRNLNTLFFNNVPRGTFISMIYGVLDVEQGTFTFARAGHNPVIVGRGVGRPPQVLQPPGLAIGLSVGPRFDDVIEEVTITLRPGDVVVLYTDGFSEAMDRHRELYGDDRLADKVAEVQHRPAAEVLRMVTEDVHRFVEAAGRQDDMTMMVLKLLPVLHPPSNGAEASRTEPSLS